MMQRALCAILCVIWTVSASAQSDIPRQIVTSDAPSSVSVTVYRNPDRKADDGMDLNYLGGYALITEQRTVSLPAGEIDLRFEGVAGGIIPQSAIVTGLPDGVIEKNRDAALLSPSALLNGYLGRGVTIRRTSAATGETREYEAQIRTDASGGMVVQTGEGFEALQCTGLNETIVYPSIPQGLSAKPTLSVKSLVATPARATVTLSYLASGFDWQANYVAEIADDGRTMNLFAWVTLANGDETSFLDAQTQTVAGSPNKEDDDTAAGFAGGEISLRCWPQDTTSDVAVQQFDRARSEARYMGKAMPAPMMAMADESDQMVMVTGSRMMARQEDLGDLKLYRIPLPVTFASQSQKQVAMFEKEAVSFEQVYQGEIWAGRAAGSRPLETMLRFKNDEQNQLGLPLPAGNLVAFKTVQGARLLLGEGNVGDKAIGEEAEIVISESPLVRYEVEQLDAEDIENRSRLRFRLKISNASDLPAMVEIAIDADDDEKLGKPSSRLSRKNGMALWRVTVPAGSEKSLTYAVKRSGN
ncbi:DUF4139 domain-containing protein [Sphingorhabdus sp. M41]|uniref:DUF4139 domain-containing protein n=1 Tax=Sphingorhabdus sp. M41 TaxID=1806885 RepID=UPI00078E5ABC|nr:DUF4139 domain-containing protein [Sphingorhabdus sp. M41]AMO71118.1 hypothetical protein AZE99_03890 [Sphingorhabdus sp. M41]